MKRIVMLLLLVGVCLGSDCQGDSTAGLDVSLGGFGDPAGTGGAGVLDSDGDGLSDSDESFRFSDPHNPDTDSDGLLDGEEVHTYGTDPTLADTDFDSLSDGARKNNWLSPDEYWQWECARPEGKAGSLRRCGLCN